MLNFLKRNSLDYIVMVISLIANEWLYKSSIFLLGPSVYIPLCFVGAVIILFVTRLSVKVTQAATDSLKPISKPASTGEVVLQWISNIILILALLIVMRFNLFIFLGSFFVAMHYIHRSRTEQAKNRE